MKNILDSYIREGYRYKVEKAVMTKETGSLTLYIRLNFIVPAEDIDRIEEAIKKQIPAVSQTDIRFIYEDVRLERADIFDRFIGHMIRMSNGRYSAVTKVIYPHEFREEGGHLIIYALGETAVRTLNRQVATEFQKMLKDNFDIDIKVDFKNHEDEYARTSMDIESRGEESSKKPATKAKTVNKTKRNDKQDTIMGREIKEPVMSISGLPETGEAVIEGRVFEITAKTVRNGKKLINILLYDGTTSACAKAFMKEEKWNDISEKLKENDLLKIKGDIEWDNFSNNIVIMAKHIEKGNQTKREDLSESKRIELHAHTKMSAMDGFNDIRGMIEQAAYWGHRAIAITDHGVVQAFPEAFKTAADLKKQTGHEIKIIYGLEGYIFDDTDCLLPDGQIDYRSKKTNHVIIIAKDQKGLKNLYRLVSESHIKYFYRKPRIPKSLLSDRREGLIIGSACAEGEVYQAVLRKYTKKQIDEIVNYYDYLEIQPLINNQFLIDGGLVSDKEELKDINRRIIDLGREHGKTVVATCDTHYTSPDDFLYRKILMAGQGYKDTEGEQGLYLRTTEEMLSEFDYLDEETAADLVIKGPGHIADMIEDILPVPFGKFPPKIEDADGILRRKCEENAKARYGDPLPDKIRERLFAELDSIIGNDYAVLYVSAEKLVQKSLSDG
nr:PHP domain-containing protein [Bacillota bacterium]